MTLKWTLRRGMSGVGAHLATAGPLVAAAVKAAEDMTREQLIQDTTDAAPGKQATHLLASLSDGHQPKKKRLGLLSTKILTLILVSTKLGAFPVLEDHQTAPVRAVLWMTQEQCPQGTIAKPDR